MILSEGRRIQPLEMSTLSPEYSFLLEWHGAEPSHSIKWD